MGQSISVLLYGCRQPQGIDVWKLIEKWEDHIGPKVNAFETRLSASDNERTRVCSWSIAWQAYVPESPCPDDSKPDDLIGFYVCHGDNDDAKSHHFPASPAGEQRRAKAIKRCRRRWSRFARWARALGVEFGKPRIWHTRTEVA